MSDDLAEYCRQVEAYLCGKNDGHLIRIVGPAFEMVCGWARQGVPLKIAFRGVDQYFERYYAKGSRRRPVRIEFCEADILDSFDSWRRAVGVAQAADDDQPGPASRPPSLASHIERVIARLTAPRAGGRRWHEFEAQIADAVRELDGLVPGARRARGAARAAIVEQLAALDRRLTDAAIAALGAETTAELRIEAERELAAFAERMPTDARARAVTAAFERLARESASLPSVRYE